MFKYVKDLKNNLSSFEFNIPLLIFKNAIFLYNVRCQKVAFAKYRIIKLLKVDVCLLAKPVLSFTFGVERVVYCL